jgi:hypothetical protein
LVNRAFGLGCVIAGIGIAGGIAAGHRDSQTYGNVLIVTDAAAVGTVPQPSTEGWLGDLRRDLAIRPDQEPAWQAYADTMMLLEASRIELERRGTNASSGDIEAERARHAMVLANALDELAHHLSLEQQTKARLLTRILSETVICRQLAIR